MSTTRERLIDAAFRLFGRGGFHGVGLDEIIAAVGISKQTFYNHFACKDDLVLAVLEHRHELESAELQKALMAIAGREPEARLRNLFDALHRWFTSPEWRGCIFITAAAEFPLPHDPAHRVACEHVLAVREQIQYLATLAGARSPRELADQLALLFEGVLVYQHVTGDPHTIATAREIGHRLIDQQLTSTQPDTPVAH